MILDCFGEVPAVQTQDGTPVGMQITDGLRPVRKGFSLLQTGEHYQVMDLPDFAARPQFQHFGNALPAGSPGISGMDMKISDEHGLLQRIVGFKITQGEGSCQRL
jgi:hypothetical protein